MMPYDKYREGTLSILDMRNLLATVTYKPGWHISLVIQDPTLYGVPSVTIRAEVEDSDGSGRRVSIGAQRPVPEVVSEKFFFRWLFSFIGDMEHHETQEWFRVDGKPIYDPHLGKEE